ncbi:MFS transporter [Actinotignum sanguinis]|uniref:MFS transporter n=2 Tax=Actinomycetaceae TaxID=2049 RepID=A0ABZ0RI28_9ACTO|nr:MULTISPECIES: MFS transporter [Actinotignum]WPJ88586.1 MFS transporter [Schaalia turicensis]MDE1655155.1 MFS transporter [Actinotignum schaalii]MDE1656847.1 MFS transporter [Actinotignum sanguinis]MDK8353972.1 MFS transporter [Actinotignum sanguinis]MDV2436214.1 MFS transporter [Actinotignum sanguinis]
MSEHKEPAVTSTHIQNDAKLCSHDARFPHSSTGLPRGGQFGLLVTLVITVLSYQLNTTMVTPALPDIGRSFAVSEGTLALVSSLFFLAGAVAGILLTRWSDFLGRARMLLAVLAILLVGTLVCALAPNFPIFVTGRVLQGVSGAVFQLAYMILSESVSPAILGTMLGIISAANGGVGGLDGWFGGILTDHFGFQAIFFVIAGLTSVAIFLTVRLLTTQERPAASGKMDWWGGGLLSLSLIFLTYYVNVGGTRGWFTTATLPLFGVAALFFSAFCMVERRVPSPLFALRQLASRHCWPLIATTLLSLASVFAVINFTVALFAQNPDAGYGLEAGRAALLYLTPPALIGLAAAPLSGWLAGKIGWLTVLRTGLLISLCTIGGIWFFLDHQWVVFTLIAILGITYNGMILTTVNGLGVILAPPEAPGSLPGLNGAAFGVGASLGIGLVAPLVGTWDGYRGALALSAGIAGIALLCACVLKMRTD